MSVAERPTRRLSGRKKALFLALLLLPLLLLAECTARVAGPADPTPITAAHPYLRHVRAPEASQELVHPRTGEAYRFTVDAYGFRCGSLVPPGQPKPKEAYRIFFVGASTTENVAVDDAESFPWRVETQLNAQLEGVAVRGVNTGIAGNTIADSFSLIAHRILALEPDLVVVLHAINDMRMSASSVFDPSHYADRLAPPKVRFSDLLERHSKLYRLFERAKKRMRTRSREEKYKQRAAETPLTEGVDPARGLPYFRRYLGMIAALCAEARVPLALMTQPSLYKPELSQAEQAALWMGYVNHGELNFSPETLRGGMQAYNDELRRFANARGLLLIDLERVVPKDLEHFYDDCHYTAQGNAVIAAEITRVLLAQGLPGRE